MTQQKRNATIHPVREGIIVGLIVWLSAGSCILGIYNWTHHALIRDVRDDLEQFAKIAAPLVDGDLHEQLVSPAQLNGELHKKVLAPLIRFHRTIPSAAYVYTCISVSNQVRFVLDTSTSSNELHTTRGYIPSLIMDVYKEPDPALLRALRDGIVISTEKPYTDEFGSFMSGYAPIFNSAGKRIGVVGVDLSLADYLSRLKAVQQVAGLTFAGMTAFAVFISLAVQRVRRRALDAEQRYRALLDVSPDAIFINRDNRVTYINPAGLRLFNAEQPEQILGRDPAELFHPDSLALIQDHIHRLLAEQKPVGLIEGKITRLDGGTVAVEISAAPFTDQGITAIQLILRDITYRKKLEGNLRQSQKMEAIGTLAGGIAHDFNNLLAVIQGNIELVLLEAGVSQDSAESLRQTYEAAVRAAALTQQLLTFSRKTSIRLQPVDLNEVISNLIKMLRRLIREDIDLECHYSGEPICLLADPSMIDQILLNLTVNARDAMPQGGHLTIRAERVELHAKDQQNQPGARPGHFAKLSVTDSGGGIAPEHLARIFDPFFTTKDIGKGTGLGLAIVHGIVEQHQGWIEVDSGIGTGTTFRVFLPVHEATPVKNSVPESPGDLPVGHETVLLVEDEPSLLTLVSRVLRRQGYQVLEADSGVAAMELWKKHAGEIDLLLTDIVMPQGISGIALAETFQAERPGLKILLTSGYSQELAANQEPNGIKWQVLEKPCPPRHVLEAIRQCLTAEPGAASAKRNGG